MSKAKQNTVVKILMVIYDNPAMLSMWRENPTNVLQEQGFSLENLTPKQTKEYSEYLKTLHFPRETPPGEMFEGIFVGGWWACTGCKTLIGATVLGVAAGIIAICVATDGAATEMAPEIAEGVGAEAIAVETGLSVAKVAKICAAAFVAEGALGFAGAAIEELCKAMGHCS